MNKLYRLIHLNPFVAIKKIIGYEELYTICIKRKDESYFYPIKCNLDYSYADPIIYNINNKEYLFVEIINNITKKGSIGYIEIGNINKKEIKEIIAEKYHMSFPMVFVLKNNIYMIPETSADKAINIYKYNKKIKQWQNTNKFNIGFSIVDITIINIEDSKIEALASRCCDENPFMCTWSRITLEFNNNNFILKEIEELNRTPNYHSRSAGNLVRGKKATLLPVQVSSKFNYGFKTELIDFDLFKKGEYRTERIITVDNTKVLNINKRNIVGIHTYATNESIEIIDIRYLKFNLKLRLERILYSLSKRGM